MNRANNHTGNSQNYNRYSYVLNNPLKYTDLYGNEASMETAVGASLAGFGGSLENVYSSSTAGFNLYSVSAFGNTTIVSSFGDIGNVKYSVNGGLTFENQTAGAYAGEVSVGSAGGGDLFGNTVGLQSTAFEISLGSGIWGEATRDLGKTTSTVTAEIQAAKVIGNIGKVARIGNIVGNTLSIGANSINVYYNPTPGNIGRLSVSVIATSANGLNLVIPGLGTGISIGISVADAAWGHYLYDGLDNYFGTAP